ncbi:hypothetical protein PRIPAC_97582 [Pristionchus pacificus]|uniref:Trypsin n=1 Tax=Pristionchus pacificus TaxID=54126 RepID=A0A2A6BXF2_PRIPA|nr:hypothetical protein PRIPAC_97582 [Pristionchus pacificus]|eukprot:PDM70682.1 Trypsin [Pristionchus pacificus]
MKIIIQMVVIQIVFLISLHLLSSAQECGISNPIEEQKTEGIAPLGKWPWQVYVYTPQAVCGGTIISEQWVLTAAHCFQSQLNGEIFDKSPQIRAGVVNIKELDGSKLFDVLKFYTHEEFENKTYKNDIALLQLEHPIVYSNTISPICLANKDQNITVHQEAWIAGFDDTTDEVTQHISSILRETSIRLSLHSKCKERWDNNGNADHLICAGSHGIGAGRVAVLISKTYRKKNYNNLALFRETPVVR